MDFCKRYHEELNKLKEKPEGTDLFVFGQDHCDSCRECAEKWNMSQRNCAETIAIEEAQLVVDQKKAIIINRIDAQIKALEDLKEQVEKALEDLKKQVKKNLVSFRKQVEKFS